MVDKIIFYMQFTNTGATIAVNRDKITNLTTTNNILHWSYI